LGIDSVVAEKCLGHTLSSQMEVVYNQHDFTPDIGKALLKLEDELLRIKNKEPIPPVA
jgi:hypothetical protein